MLIAAAVPALAIAYVLALFPFTPSIGDIRKVRLQAPTIVMTADGKELATFQRANRDWVKLAGMSQHTIAALIATEDHRFRTHHGIDFKRTASALAQTLGGDTQGGSTITQQLARNLYPQEIGRANSVTRKVKEAITALKIEAVYSKDEILETYLNTVPFLYNAYGIEMAARTYFDKSADALGVLESATLVGMLKGTSYYNPVQNPERATQRRNTVLGQMAKHGKLGAAQLAELRKQPLKVDFERQTEELGPAPHFTQLLRKWLIEWADQNDYNIYTDGLVVRTTIDARLQEAATDAVARQADRLQLLADAQWGARAGWSARNPVVATLVRESQPYRAAVAAGTAQDVALKQVLADESLMLALRQDKTRLQAGFLALDPHNGHVKAWVGSREFTQDQFDHVQQARRQPGSTFKPFVYGAAFEAGVSPAETMLDQAVEISLGEGAVWRPGDAGAPSGNAMSLRDGLVYSKNTITAQLIRKIGPGPVAQLARAMGVRHSKLDEVLSLGLGTSPVTLKEMVTAYGTIANGGSTIEPVLVTQIADRNGLVLAEFAPKPAAAGVSNATAQTLVDVLRGVIDRGTGTAIRSRYGIQADVAGKTGTTQDNTDGWFILMHTDLVAGAWVGFNDNRVTMGEQWGQGARSALPIVGDFFQQAFKLKVIDAKARFSAPPALGPALPVLDRLNNWFGGMFPPAAEAERAAEALQPPLPRQQDAVVIIPDVQTDRASQTLPFPQASGPAQAPSFPQNQALPLEPLPPELGQPRRWQRAQPPAVPAASGNALEAAEPR